MVSQPAKEFSVEQKAAIEKADEILREETIKTEYRETLLMPVPTDRWQEVEIIVRVAYRNLTRPSTSTAKPILMFMPQLYGCGKTYLGFHAIAILKAALTASFPKGFVIISGRAQATSSMIDPNSLHPLIQALLFPNTVQPVADPSSFLGQLRANGEVSLRFIREFSDSRTILVDIKKMASSGGGILSHTFNLEIFRIGANADIPLILKYSELAKENPIAVLEEVTGHKGNWFVCFDEVGVVEDIDFQQRYPALSQVKADSEQRMRVLLSAIDSVLKAPKISAICAGRSAEFARRAASLMPTSKFDLRFFPLGTFSVINVETFLQKSIIKGNSPWNHLLGSDIEYSVNDLARLIHEWSGGVPRVIAQIVEDIVPRAEKMKTFSGAKVLLGPDGIIGQSASTLATVSIHPEFYTLHAYLQDKYASLLLVGESYKKKKKKKPQHFFFVK